MLKLFIKRCYRLFLSLIKINLFEFLRFYTLNSSKANFVVWVYPRSFKYIFTTSIIWDLATIKCLIEKRQKFTIFIGIGIGKISGKSILFTIHKNYNIYDFTNYVKPLHFILSELSKTNSLIPSLNEALFWENKAYMHKQFNLLNIPSPHTEIVNIRALKNFTSKLKDGFIVKEVHSYESKGLHLVKTETDLQLLINKLLLTYNAEDLVLVQDKVEMRRDLRVIIVHGKIIHYYWRINLSDHWRPTATSKGNRVDFFNFPVFHEKEIIAYSKKLGLSTCAFDITWENDNTSTDPIVLEVSPVYSPNPKISNQKDLDNYGEFKTKLQLYGYDYLYVNQIFDIKTKHLTSYLD